MNAYQFLAKLPSNGSVASVVTLLVSAWFLVAAGAILTDPTSVYTQRATVTAQSDPPALLTVACERSTNAAHSHATPTVVASPSRSSRTTMRSRRAKPG